ncbi:Cuticle protein CPCFC [Popillia japonica]|uniref:Cuticle protein CPCFC n=1 Tax=Popillia japonica TaxID=7064 RepID=A0AAW1L9V4_POPJA
MFVKLAVLACTFAFALGAWHGPLAGGVPAHQFPAGVSPQACPNYPNCNNPAVAAAPNAPGAYPGAYNQGGYNGGAYNPGAYNQGAYNPGAYNPGHAAAPVPAGVDPHSCPNYPFCH